MAGAPHPDSAFLHFGLFSSCISKHSGDHALLFLVGVHLFRLQKFFHIAYVLLDGRNSTNMPFAECLTLLRGTTKT
jgi:hypothetical protein